MSRRTDKFKKILPNDAARPRGLDVTVSTGSPHKDFGGKPATTFTADPPAGVVPKQGVAPKRKVENTDFRIRLDFTIRVSGDVVTPDIFGPKYMNFITAGIRETMLKEPEYKDNEHNVDVLPGSALSVTVNPHKEKR